MNPDDKEAAARQKRAEELRSSIQKIETGDKPQGVPTPREITDEAARKARDNAKDQPADSKDR
jgi:hypothetical protein